VAGTVRCPPFSIPGIKLSTYYCFAKRFLHGRLKNEDKGLMMQKIHSSILINAPREKVWHAMLDDKPYREWTKAF
jgi:hypothetical protein